MFSMILPRKRIDVLSFTQLSGNPDNAMLIKTVLHALTLIFSLFLGHFLPINAFADNTYQAASRTSGIHYTSYTNRHSTRQELLRYFGRWKGVPHQWGGLSRRGIDCSGLVYRTYRDVFGIELPRSTQLQARAGDVVRPYRLSAGDLVFFRIGQTSRHVGIYLGNGQFMHASKSRGVMISSLDNPYWSKTYWKALRVMN